MAVLFVTHNLALVPMIATRVVVMYAGQIVEAGGASEVLAAPRHPYTRALLECLPARHLPRDAAARQPLPTIEGSSAVRPAAGCAFAPRCPLAAPECRTGEIALRPGGAEGRLSRCIRAELL
jgi:oligopeptide/dipeptide ABC transporter ATP-binding protein